MQATTLAKNVRSKVPNQVCQLCANLLCHILSMAKESQGLEGQNNCHHKIHYSETSKSAWPLQRLIYQPSIALNQLQLIWTMLISHHSLHCADFLEKVLTPNEKLMESPESFAIPRIIQLLDKTYKDVPKDIDRVPSLLPKLLT